MQLTLLVVIFTPFLLSLKARVKPSCGRLVGFTSGPVNPHGVTAVTAGRRCALALWFTTEKRHRDMVREYLRCNRLIISKHIKDLIRIAITGYMIAYVFKFFPSTIRINLFPSQEFNIAVDPVDSMFPV